GVAPGSRGAHRNARRNRPSVVSTADLHPRHHYRSGAPSSKANDSRRVLAVATDLSTSFAVTGRDFEPLSTPYPRRHGQPSSSGQMESAGRAGRPRSSTSIAGDSPNLQRRSSSRSTRTGLTSSHRVSGIQMTG